MCDWPTQLFSATSSSSPGNQIVPVSFKMTGFEKMSNSRNWSSESFFTSRFGYRIQLEIGAVNAEIHIVQFFSMSYEGLI